MTNERIVNLIKAKTALAQKYDRRALTAKSKPRQKTLLSRAEKYHHQAKQLSKLQETPGV